MPNIINEPNIIAIDGVSASGKGTLARKIAQYLQFAYLDTGKLYRAVGHFYAQNGLNTNDISAGLAFIPTITPQMLANPEYLTEHTAKMASILSAKPEIRDGLLHFQQNFGKNAQNGAVLDGRDIGTIIFPHATIKFYITCPANIRAERRMLELQAMGKPANFDEIYSDIMARDERDMNRTIAPLKPADDAFTIDTNKSPDECFNEAMAIIRSNAPAHWLPHQP